MGVQIRVLGPDDDDVLTNARRLGLAVQLCAVAMRLHGAARSLNVTPGEVEEFVTGGADDEGPSDATLGYSFDL